MILSASPELVSSVDGGGEEQPLRMTELYDETTERKSLYCISVALTPHGRMHLRMLCKLYGLPLRLAYSLWFFSASCFVTQAVLP